MNPITRFALSWLLIGFIQSAHADQAVHLGAIASAHPLATEAGFEILKKGGNAFDAAVAVSAALSVVEPFDSGLGGGGLWLLHRASDGRDVMIDGRETAPLAATSTMYVDKDGQPIPRASLDGPKAAAVPGLPAGLAWMTKHYGRLSLKTDLAPAIRYAKEGFAVDSRYLDMARMRFRQLSSDPGSSGIFLNKGAVPAVGDIIRQPGLASTLQALANKGNAGFYQGPVAQELVRAVRAGGGIWSAKDLTDYRVRERKPVVFTYHNIRIVSASLPSSGGLVLAEAMNILEPHDLDKMDEITRMHWVIEAMRRAYHDRARYMGDDDFVKVPVDKLVSKEYALQRAKDISPDNGTPSDQLESANPVFQGNHTTHFSVMDKEGNRVAGTQTLNLPFGSAFVAGNTGVLLNNEMDDFSMGVGVPNAYGLVGSRPNLIAPGKRPLSSMSPTMAEDGRGTLVIGTPGGSRIISMVLLGLLDYANPGTPDLARMVAVPRYHHQYLPDRVDVEKGRFPDEVLQELELRGYILREVPRPWGNMQAVWGNKSLTVFQAASDPRGVGQADVK